MVNPQAAHPDARERQSEYMRKVAEQARAVRSARLDRLRDTADRIKRATASLEELDKRYVDLVRLREDFVCLREPRSPGGRPSNEDIAYKLSQSERLQRDIDTRPPLTRLIYRRSYSLHLYLTAVCVAHLEGDPGKGFVNHHGLTAKTAGLTVHTWARLAGIDDSRDTPRARRQRVKRALDELAKAELVSLGSAREKYEKFELLREDGSGRKYRLPGESAEDVISIPMHFFLRGWHLVLTPKEIATYVMILHLTHQRNRANRPLLGEQLGVVATQSVREQKYGLSGEAYESIHELEEFGLIDVHDPMPERRRGKIRPRRSGRSGRIRTESGATPVPYRFIVRDVDAGARALDVVMTRLSSSPLPPRLGQTSFFL